MHKVVVPKLSGVHRFACLALYRALLRQCTRLPNTTPEFSTPKLLIKQRFHRYKSLQSPSQTANALEAGYEALDLLHTASRGDQKSVSRIATLISESKSIREKNSLAQRILDETKLKPKSSKEEKKELSRRLQETTSQRHPDTKSILSRPRLNISGKRRVPVLVSARGVPFLRIKKPQPKNLSGAISSKLSNRWRRIERRDRLQRELLFAGDEDFWDELTAAQKSGSWSHEVQRSIKDVNSKIWEGDQKTKKLAEAMWGVVLLEKELAAEEEKKKATE